MSTNAQHLSPHKRGWSVRKNGAARATRVFATQEEALAFARRLSKQQHVALYIHKPDGTVQRKETYTAALAPA